MNTHLKKFDKETIARIGVLIGFVVILLFLIDDMQKTKTELEKFEGEITLEMLGNKMPISTFKICNEEGVCVNLIAKFNSILQEMNYFQAVLIVLTIIIIGIEIVVLFTKGRLLLE